MKDFNPNILLVPKEVSSGKHMTSPTAFSIPNYSKDKRKKKKKKANIKNATGLLSIHTSTIDHRTDSNFSSTNYDSSNEVGNFKGSGSSLGDDGTDIYLFGGEDDIDSQGSRPNYSLDYNGDDMAKFEKEVLKLAKYFASTGSFDKARKVEQILKNAQTSLTTVPSIGLSPTFAPITEDGTAFENAMSLAGASAVGTAGTFGGGLGGMALGGPLGSIGAGLAGGAIGTGIGAELGKEFARTIENLFGLSASCDGVEWEADGKTYFLEKGNITQDNFGPVNSVIFDLRRDISNPTKIPAAINILNKGISQVSPTCKGVLTTYLNTLQNINSGGGSSGGDPGKTGIKTIPGKEPIPVPIIDPGKTPVKGPNKPDVTSLIPKDACTVQFPGDTSGSLYWYSPSADTFYQVVQSATSYKQMSDQGGYKQYKQMSGQGDKVTTVPSETGTEFRLGGGYTPPPPRPTRPPHIDAVASKRKSDSITKRSQLDPKQLNTSLKPDVNTSSVVSEKVPTPFPQNIGEKLPYDKGSVPATIGGKVPTPFPQNINKNTMAEKGGVPSASGSVIAHQKGSALYSILMQQGVGTCLPKTQPQPQPQPQPETEPVENQEGSPGRTGGLNIQYRTASPDYLTTGNYFIGLSNQDSDGSRGLPMGIGDGYKFQYAVSTEPTGTTWNLVTANKLTAREINQLSKVPRQKLSGGAGGSQGVPTRRDFRRMTRPDWRQRGGGPFRF